MFVRHGARRAPLTRPYDGPFRVLQRGEKFFTVKVGAKEQVVSVDCLKPAFGFVDPAPAVPDTRIKKTSSMAKIPATKVSTTRKSLNPARRYLSRTKLCQEKNRQASSKIWL